MKPLLILLFAVFAVISTARAQKPDSASVMVHYKFSHMRDTTKPADLYTENMILLLGKSSSVYKSFDKKTQDAMVRKQIAEQVAANGGAPGNINIKRVGRSSSDEYFQFPLQNKLVRKERLINAYLIEEPLPAIKWQISSDTASFAGLNCQKATGHFRGRDYTAWFCPDLPFRSGPWKLNGLPGLIVEAYDTGKQVVFKFDGIEETSKIEKAAPVAAPATPPGGLMVRMIGMDEGNEDPRVIALPADAIKTTEKEFANLKEAMRKDPNAFLQSAMAGSGNVVRMNPNAGPGTRIEFRGTPPTINNPLELPEKK